MSARGEGLRRIEKDIVAEKAATLGRAGERLEQALAEVTELGARLAAATDPQERARLGPEYERARARAASARLGLLIQREAIGLRHHRIVDQQFPEPPPLEAGPCSRGTAVAGSASTAPTPLP
ncbi:MAG TPA: hypothetical protein VGV13_02980 [Methylomirabilota bacterium]|jgi:hypothetical protein|nr:hypothetical protein [Methylomirabilota bacterium]